MKKVIFVTISLHGLFSFFTAVAFCQEIRLTVSYPGVSASLLPPWIAKETGIFSKNGLEVELIRALGPVAIRSVLAGEMGIINVSGPPVVQSNFRGSDVVFIAGGYSTLDYQLISQKQIKTAGQLKGGTLGLSGFGDASYIATVYTLRKLGLRLNDDVSVVVIGGTPERLIALQNGRIQATMLSPPTSLIAEKSGYNILVDVGALGINFQHNGVATTKKFIRENRDTVKRYVKSQLEAVHLMKTDRKTTLRILSKFLRQTDEVLLGRIYDLSVKGDKFSSNQYPSIPGLKTIVDLLSAEDLQFRQAKPEQFVDQGIVNEFEKTGFIAQLYKGEK